MNGLREWAASSKQTQRAAADKHLWDWVVQGGRPAMPDNNNNNNNSGSSYATLYCTGHSDGAVRLWDMHAQAPQLLGTVPSSAAAHALSSGRKMRSSAVCTLEFAWEQGLLISGHESGEVSSTLLLNGRWRERTTVSMLCTCRVAALFFWAESIGSLVC